MDHYVAHSLYAQLYDNANVTVQGTLLESEVALNDKVGELVIMCKEQFRDSSVTPLAISRYIHQCLESDQYSPLYDSSIKQCILTKCLKIILNIGSYNNNI